MILIFNNKILMYDNDKKNMMLPIFLTKDNTRLSLSCS